MDPLCSSRVIVSRRDVVRAMTTPRPRAGGRNIERYVHGHAVPLGEAIAGWPDHRVIDFA